MSVTHASISPAPLVAQPANFSDQEPHTHRPTKGLGQALKPWAKSQSPSTPRAGGAGGARHGPTILNQQTPTPPTSPHPNTPAPPPLPPRHAPLLHMSTRPSRCCIRLPGGTGLGEDRRQVGRPCTCQTGRSRSGRICCHHCSLTRPAGERQAG